MRGHDAASRSCSTARACLAISRSSRASEQCEPEDLKRLREIGYRDEDILHIAELTAIFNYNGILANAMGLVPNAQYHELGRQLK